MGKAILGWVGALGLVLFVVAAWNRPPSAAQRAASASLPRTLEVEAIRADNARLAAAWGVEPSDSN